MKKGEKRTKERTGCSNIKSSGEEWQWKMRSCDYKSIGSKGQKMSQGGGAQMCQTKLTGLVRGRLRNDCSVWQCGGHWKS